MWDKLYTLLKQEQDGKVLDWVSCLQLLSPKNPPPGSFVITEETTQESRIETLIQEAKVEIWGDQEASPGAGPTPRLQSISPVVTVPYQSIIHALATCKSCWAEWEKNKESFLLALANKHLTCMDMWVCITDFWHNRAGILGVSSLWQMAEHSCLLLHKNNLQKGTKLNMPFLPQFLTTLISCMDFCPSSFLSFEIEAIKVEKLVLFAHQGRSKLSLKKVYWHQRGKTNMLQATKVTAEILAVLLQCCWCSQERLNRTRMVLQLKGSRKYGSFSQQRSRTRSGLFDHFYSKWEDAKITPLRFVFCEDFEPKTGKLHLPFCNVITVIMTSLSIVF